MDHNLSGTPGQTGSNLGGGQATEQARQQGEQLGRQVRQQASTLANRGSEQVKGQLANQKHDVSQRMVPIQSALRETAQQLRRQGQGSVGQYADRVADQVERFSSYLRETEVDEIADEVRGFARRRPAVFLGGAVALGFLGTRFLKSSSEQAQGAIPGPESGAATYYGTGEPTTALPPSTAGTETPTVEGGTPNIRRTPMTGQPGSDRDRFEPPRGT